jgi:hypothetical protein
VLAYRLSSAVRLFTTVFALMIGVTVLPGARISAVGANRVSSVDSSRPLTGLCGSPERLSGTSPGSTQPRRNRTHKLSVLAVQERIV